MGFRGAGESRLLVSQLEAGLLGCVRFPCAGFWSLLAGELALLLVQVPAAAGTA